MIEFIEQHEIAFQILLTAVIALSALASSAIAVLILFENRLLRKVGTEPKLVAYFIPHLNAGGAIHLAIANIGKGPAVNISFDIEIDATDLAGRKHSFPASRNARKLTAIPEGEKHLLFVGMGWDLLEPKPLKPFTVRMTYENVSGKNSHNLSTVDINELLEIQTITAQRDDSTVQMLKKILQSLNNSQNGTRPYAVRTRDDK